MLCSPISNEYHPDAGYPQLPVESAWIYNPQPGWSFSHHAHVTWFRGKFHAIWSNGRVNEDDLGQRVLTASSVDFHHWSTPQPLIGSHAAPGPETVLTAAGFHQHDGKLVAYIGAFEYSPDALLNGVRPFNCKGHMHTRMLISTTIDGNIWSDFINTQIPIVPNHGPQAIASGRLIISGNIMFPYSDDASGLTGWTQSGIYPSGMTIADDSEGLELVKKAAQWPVPMLCEGSFFQTDDSVLHMMLRTNSEMLWLTESRDDGASWSKPTPTEFSDNSTKFHFGRLPDGRFYYIGCPDPQPQWRRSPLVLSLSTDGIRFNRHYIFGNAPYERRYEGMHKVGSYGYPHSMVHDGYLYVIFSRQKEAIEISRVALRDIPG